MVELKETGRIQNAASLLVDELMAAEARIETLEGELVTLRARRARLVESVAALRADLPREVSHGIDDRLREAQLPIAPIRSEKIRALIQLMKKRPEEVFRVETAQAYLRQSGFNVSEKYAANTMQRMCEAGLLTKVGRGLYRFDGQTLAIEGLLPEDYE